MVIATLPKIKVTAGIIRYNFRCQYNSVHDALNDNQEKVAMCIYIDEGFPVIHFVNYDNGVFTDNTLGRWCEKYDYYLVRFIDKESFWDIDNIFVAYRKELHRRLPFWVRLLSNVEF